MNRFAPEIEDHVHQSATLYLIHLSLNWKLRAMGEPHELTPSLLEEWSQHRETIARCRREPIRFEDWRRNLSDSPHARTIEVIDDIVRRLIEEYEFPKPTKPQVTKLDIDVLWKHINVLDRCRTPFKLYR